MEIQLLIDAYRKNAAAFYAAVSNNTLRKNTNVPSKPDYQAEVIVPILNELVRLLPEFRLNPPDELYAIRCDFYYIYYGKFMVGGLQPDEDYNLTFTPLGKRSLLGRVYLYTIWTNWLLRFGRLWPQKQLLNKQLIP